jgi:hypothetical protein
MLMNANFIVLASSKQTRLMVGWICSLFKNQFICITPVSGKNIAFGSQKLKIPR